MVETLGAMLWGNDFSLQEVDPGRNERNVVTDNPWGVFQEALIKIIQHVVFRLESTDGQSSSWLRKRQRLVRGSNHTPCRHISGKEPK